MGEQLEIEEYLERINVYTEENRIQTNTVLRRIDMVTASGLVLDWGDGGEEEWAGGILADVETEVVLGLSRPRIRVNGVVGPIVPSCLMSGVF